jgi:hypothetical protein
MWPGYGDHMGWMWLGWVVGLGLLMLLVWAIARQPEHQVQWAAMTRPRRFSNAGTRAGRSTATSTNVT